jgi:hypothetical protein
MHELPSEPVQKLSGMDTREIQTFLITYKDTHGSLDISATAQVAIIITDFFLKFTTKEVLKILPLQRCTRG